MRDDFDFEEDKQLKANDSSIVPPSKDEVAPYRTKGKPPFSSTKPAGYSSYKGDQHSDIKSTYSRKKENTQTDKKEQPGFSPEAIHYNYFYLGISGTIEAGDFPYLDGLNCKYTLLCGKDWQLAEVLI